MKNEVIDVVAAAIWDGVDRVLIGQRAEFDSFAGKWEFVGGKKEDDETLSQALHREIREELGIEIEILKKIGTYNFKGIHHNFKLHVYFALWTRGVAEAFEHQCLEWVRQIKLEDKDWSEPDKPFLSAVEDLLHLGVKIS